MIKWLIRLFARPPAVIEEAALKDAPAFARLHAISFHRGWSEQEFEQLLSERNVVAHRLRAGGLVAGFIISRLASDEAEILSVAISPRERGRGLSQKLLLNHMGVLAARGIRKMFLEVEEGNVPARRLYSRAGFRDVALREGYYQRGGSAGARAVVMSRDLS